MLVDEARYGESKDVLELVQLAAVQPSPPATHDPRARPSETRAVVPVKVESLRLKCTPWAPDASPRVRMV